MKFLMSLIIGFGALINGIAFADSIASGNSAVNEGIIKDTEGWRNISIKLGEDQKTYTLEDAKLGVAPLKPNTYYSYPGYRCLSIVNAKYGEPVTLTRTGGLDQLSCYKVPLTPVIN